MKIAIGDLNIVIGDLDIVVDNLNININNLNAIGICCDNLQHYATVDHHQLSMDKHALWHVTVNCGKDGLRHYVHTHHLHTHCNFAQLTRHVI